MERVYISNVLMSDTDPKNIWRTNPEGIPYVIVSEKREDGCVVCCKVTEDENGNMHVLPQCFEWLCPADDFQKRIGSITEEDLLIIREKICDLFPYY